jgi:Flp pilus assembly protein TadD
VKRSRWVLRAATLQGRYWAIRAANRLAIEALAHLETLPPSVELHLIKAEIAQSRGAYPDAVREVREALTLAPGESGHRDSACRGTAARTQP